MGFFWIGFSWLGERGGEWNCFGIEGRGMTGCKWIKVLELLAFLTKDLSKKANEFFWSYFISFFLEIQDFIFPIDTIHIVSYKKVEWLLGSMSIGYCTGLLRLTILSFSGTKEIWNCLPDFLYRHFFDCIRYPVDKREKAHSSLIKNTIKAIQLIKIWSLDLF